MPLLKTLSQQPKHESAKIGNTFESEIQRACDLYLKLDVAYIQKNATPTAWVPMNKNTGKGGFLIHSKKASIDFTGTVKIARSDELVWVPFFMEAKSVAEGNLDLYAQKGGLTDIQIRIMDWLEERGIHVYLIWRVRKAETTFLVSPSQIRECTEVGPKGGRHLSMEKCRTSRVPRLSKVKYQGEEYLDFLNILGDFQ